MITPHEQRAYDLRCKAEAIEKSKQKVAVELSLPAAWLLRDLIGLAHLSDRGGLPLVDDMRALNEVLGYRPTAPASELPQAHVAGWSKHIADEVRRERR